MAEDMQQFQPKGAPERARRAFYPRPEHKHMPKRVSIPGTLAALLHLLLLAGAATAILSSSSPQWPQYWFIFLALDFPVSLGVAPVSWLVPASARGPLSDFSNFWWPLAYHGVVGTGWWYIVGWAIARKLTRRAAPETTDN
jgi:hypothetical protein